MSVWLDITLSALVIGSYSVGLVALGWWMCVQRWQSTHPMAAHTGDRCDYPGCFRERPKHALRRHDGRRPCHEHKEAEYPA